jgi:plastocyanin
VIARRPRKALHQLLLLLPMMVAEAAYAEMLQLKLQLKDHLFSPTTLYVPAGEKIKLVIDNQDNTPEEFESFSLNREKVILGQKKAVVFIGPLEPGEHPFFGEYHPDSARGVIIVLPKAQWQQQVAREAKGAD